MNLPTAPPREPLLEVRDLRKTFRATGFFARGRPVCAAWDVCLRVGRGEAVALVGESGSGKSTVARMLLRLESADAGQIRLGGDDVLAREPRRASLRYRGRVQMVFQDPFGSLNPVHTVAHHLIRPLLRHRRADAAGARARALELLATVGLEPAADFIDRHPYELSGGQRQRVAIARALAVEPDVLVADEPTSMLDVSIRAGILTLLAQLKRERGLGILLITHDLASARFLADRILVMLRGRVVEEGPAAELISDPAHPYTRALLAAITGAPVATETPRVALDRAGAGERGCPFADRCPDVLDICISRDPAPRPYLGRQVRCHLHPEPTGAPRD